MFIPFMLSNWLRFSNLFEFVPEVAMCGHVASNKHAGLISMYVQLVSGFSCNCTVGKWRPEDAEVVVHFNQMLQWKSCLKNVEKLPGNEVTGLATYTGSLAWAQPNSCLEACTTEVVLTSMKRKAKKCHLFAMSAMCLGSSFHEVSCFFHEICWYMLIADIVYHVQVVIWACMIALYHVGCAALHIGDEDWCVRREAEQFRLGFAWCLVEKQHTPHQVWKKLLLVL